MLNIFDKFFTHADPDEVEMTPEELAAHEKKERIAYHRTQVRNGPVTFKSLTAGQARRHQARRTQSAIRKNFKRDVRNHHERLRVASVLRPHLQTIGLIPTHDNRAFSLQDEVVSTAWIVQRYGTETTLDGEKTGFVSFAYDDVLAAIKFAAKFYGTATGYLITVPADFEVAIYAEAGDAIV